MNLPTYIYNMLASSESVPQDPNTSRQRVVTCTPWHRRGEGQERGGASSDVLHCGQEPEAEEWGGELAVSERGGEVLAELW